MRLAATCEPRSDSVSKRGRLSCEAGNSDACRDLITYGGIRAALDEDRAAEIAATFQRIRRPLRWPMENFRRQRVSNRRFVGFRFSRVRRGARAGFAFGFALNEDSLPAIREPPEVVAYVFVDPENSALHRALVEGRASAVRRLVTSSERMGFPFEFHSDGPVVAVRHRSLARAEGDFRPGRLRFPDALLQS